MLANPSIRELNYEAVLDQALRILVTDDDPIMREFASVYLSTETAVIETAESGEEALRRLIDETFDLLMVDIDMPGLNGYEVIERVRGDARIAHTPIIVVTSNEDMASIDRAFGAGATSFVTKPVNWRLLSYQIKYVARWSRNLCDGKCRSRPMEPQKG